MIERIAGLIGLVTLIAGVAFAGYQYREVHLPQFEELQATVEYQKCIQQCIETCRDNGVPIDQCRCDRCNVYRAQ
jgi:hypothetical protein